MADINANAFRKNAQRALNMNKKIMKKLELHNYLEDMRLDANRNIFDFFKGIDPDTAPRNMRLLYYYYLSSSNLYSSMQDESIQEYKKDDLMTSMAQNERKFAYRSPDQV